MPNDTNTVTAERYQAVVAQLTRLRSHQNLTDEVVAKRLNGDQNCSLFVDGGWTPKRVRQFASLFGVGFRRPGPGRPLSLRCNRSRRMRCRPG